MFIYLDHFGHYSCNWSVILLSVNFICNLHVYAPVFNVCGHSAYISIAQANAMIQL